MSELSQSVCNERKTPQQGAITNKALLSESGPPAILFVTFLSLRTSKKLKAAGVHLLSTLLISQQAHEVG